MCGGKKEDKKTDATPEPPADAPPPAEEPAPPLPAEEPKGAGSAAKSMGNKMTDSKMAAAQPSIALFSGRKGLGAGLAKGPVGAESVAAKGASSLMLTSGRAAGPKGAKSQAFGGKSAVKAN